MGVVTIHAYLDRRHVFGQDVRVMVQVVRV